MLFYKKIERIKYPKNIIKKNFPLGNPKVQEVKKKILENGI